MSVQTDNVADAQKVVTLGKGAQFWAYISPQNDTAHAITKWEVRIEQQNGNWVGTITSDNPYAKLQTPGLAGIFNVTVTASGPQIPEQQLSVQAGTKPQIGCRAHCAAMVGIIADPSGTAAHYWTTWDALCG